MVNHLQFLKLHDSSLIYSKDVWLRHASFLIYKKRDLFRDPFKDVLHVTSYTNVQSLTFVQLLLQPYYTLNYINVK